MYLRMGMFTAENDGVEIAVSNSGGSIIIEVKEKDWEKKNPGKITPFRYKLTAQAICNLAMDEYEHDSR